MFTGLENAYYPGIAVEEVPEKASSFSRTAGGLEKEQTLALIWDTATQEEGKVYVRGENLSFDFWVGGLEAQKDFKWLWVCLPHSGHGCVV